MYYESLKELPLFKKGTVFRYTGKRLVNADNDSQRLSRSVNPEEHPQWFREMESFKVIHELHNDPTISDREILIEILSAVHKINEGVPKPKKVTKKAKL